MQVGGDAEPLEHAEPLDLDSAAPSKRRRKWLVIGGGTLAVLLAAAAIAAYFLWPGIRGSEPEGTARYFPEDTSVYSWLSFSPGMSQGRQMRELWDRLEELPGFSEAIDDLLGEAEAETGIDFEEQVLPWFGPDVSVGMLGVGTEQQAPEVVALFGVRDHSAASAFVRDLLAYVQQDGAQLERADSIDGFEVWSDWDTGAGLALSGDWLVAATTEAALSDVAGRIARPGHRSLADSDDFQQARLAMRDERMMSLYIDVEALEDLASELSGLGEDPGPALEPEDLAAAMPVTVGDTASGQLEFEEATDVFAFEGEAGVQYQIDITLGTLADSMVTLYDVDGIALEFNDDFDLSLASRIDWRARDAGRHYVAVGGFAGATGSYTLAVTEIDEEGGVADAAANAAGDFDLPEWVAASVGFVDLGIVIEWATPTDPSAFADLVLSDDPAMLLPEDTVSFGAAAFEPDMDRWRAELGQYTVADLLGTDVANDFDVEVGLDTDSTLADLLDDVVEAIDDEIGISLEEDFFDLLGGQAVLGVREFDFERVTDPEGYAIDVIAAMSYTPGGEEGLMRTVDKLVDLLEEASDGELPARASKDIAADHEAVTFSGAGGEAFAAYSPTYVFHDGYMTVGTTERALRAVVDAQNGTRGNLAETREYRRARGGLPDTLQFLMYLDLHRIIAGLDPDAVDIDPDLHQALEGMFGAVAVGVSTDADYTRASLVMTLFPQ